MSYGILRRKPNPATVLVNNHEPMKPSPRNIRISSFFNWKRMVDLPLAVILFIPASPIIGLLWLLVKATSPGPGFYRQQRVGRFGRLYLMFKLRSMRQDAEAGTGAVWCSTDDPRVTWLGNLLRKFHLDELPQLYNVLKGEMSLVGPRPERPEFVQVLSKKINGYQHRLAVPPGITGLAQLNLPPDTDLDSVARKLVLDLEYIAQAGLWLEMKLLMCTAARMVKLPAIGLLGLHRSVTLPAATSHQEICDEKTPSLLAGHAAHPPVNGNGKGHTSTDSAIRKQLHHESISKAR